jgi:hypothetical protein
MDINNIFIWLVRWWTVWVSGTQLSAKLIINRSNLSINWDIY